MEPQQGDGQDGHLELSLREEEELRLPGEAVDLPDPQPAPGDSAPEVLEVPGPGLLNSRPAGPSPGAPTVSEG